MIRFLSFLLLTGLAYSCGKAGGGKYVNHEKWSLANPVNPASLRNKPSEVRENLYLNLTDTSFSNELSGTFNDYWLYRFDKEGNIEFIRVFMDSSFINDTYYRFDENGEQYERLSYGNGDTMRSKKTSQNIGDGKFRSEVYNDSIHVYTYNISFLEEADKVVTDIINNRNNTVSQIIRWYKDNKPVKMFMKSYEGEKEQLYHYSPEGFLDSIVVRSKEGDFEKHVYVNNKFGDPVYYEEWDKAGRTERRWMKYVYDEKNNWIKRISRQEGRMMVNFGHHDDKKKFPNHDLVVREIKY